MKSYIFCVFIIFVLLVCPGCHRSIDRQLFLADSLMASRPDSALSILESLNVDKTDAESSAWHILMIAKAKTKLNQTIEDDSLIHVSVQYYDDRRDSLEIQSKFYYGMYLNYHEKYEDALIMLTIAYDLAENLKNYFYMGLISRELCTAYGELQIADLELDWALKEKENYKRAGYPLHTSWADLDIITGYLKCGKLEEGWSVLENIDTVEYNKSAYFRKYVDSLKGSILHTMRESARSLSAFSKLHDDFGSLNAGQWAYVAQDNLRLGKMNEARMVIDSAYFYAETPLDSVRVWYVDAQLKAHEGDYRNAYDRAMKFGEGIMRDGDERLASPPVMPLVDTLRENLAMERKLAAVERTRSYLMTAVGLLAVAVLVLVIFLQRNRLKNRGREIETAMSHAAELDNYLTALEEKSAETRRCYEAACRRVEELDGEIRNEREITGEVISEIRSLYSSRMDSLNRLFEIWHRYDGTNVSPKHFYKNMTDELEKFRGCESLSEMEGIIDRHYDGWMRRFREAFPGLSRDQYALSIYLFLGFSVGAITMLMGKRSVNAVYTAKSRLKSQLVKETTEQAEEFRRRLGL